MKSSMRILVFGLVLLLPSCAFGKLIQVENKLSADILALYAVCTDQQTDSEPANHLVAKIAAGKSESVNIPTDCCVQEIKVDAGDIQVSSSSPVDLCTSEKIEVTAASVSGIKAGDEDRGSNADDEEKEWSTSGNNAAIADDGWDVEPAGSNADDEDTVMRGPSWRRKCTFRNKDFGDGYYISTFSVWERKRSDGAKDFQVRIPVGYATNTCYWGQGPFAEISITVRFKAGGRFTTETETWHSGPARRVLSVNEPLRIWSDCTTATIHYHTGCRW